MICAQAIIHFRPEEAYGKYLRLLVSVMVLIQLFLPVGEFLFHGDSGKLSGQLELFRESLEKGMEEARENSLEAEKILEQMTLEEVRRQAEAAAREKETGSDEASSGDLPASAGEAEEAAEAGGAGETAEAGKTGEAEAEENPGDGTREVTVDVTPIQPVEPVRVGQDDDVRPGK